LDEAERNSELIFFADRRGQAWQIQRRDDVNTNFEGSKLDFEDDWEITNSINKGVLEEKAIIVSVLNTEEE
jgi:hypothetical protein